MKRVITWGLVIIVSVFTAYLSYGSKNILEPKYLYQVYLDDQVLGVIKSKNELNKYIDKKGLSIKEKYGVDKVYAPEGLVIRRVLTYDAEISSVEDVYNKLSELKPFTIDGYQFTIKREVELDDGSTATENKIVYVVKEEMFKKALENTIVSFIGSDTYTSFLNMTQKEITTTGSIYEDIYIDNNISKKTARISVEENIFTDINSLSQYILFSTSNKKKEYVVRKGDTIESVAYKNKISVEEFMISNPEFTSKDNVLYTGQRVSVAYADPIVDVVATATEVTDQVNYYTVEERESSSLNSGMEQVIQKGVNGINRVTSNVIYKNGVITKAEVAKQIEIKPAQKKVILIGTRKISGIGTGYWAWPSASHSISSKFGYRSGRLHHGLDIYGKVGTPIYAANNGIITKTGWYGTYGIFIAINHNNGYGTGYGHLNSIAPGLKVGCAVERGQIIGYMGNTGRSTGPHLHFEAYYGSNHPGYNYDRFFNPMFLY